ncbi:MAG: SRPBCC domain-containing protein [Marinoscillum sp.]
MEFIVDKENSTVNITREFEAPQSDVWAAWTQPEILDQWWAPQPWKSVTKTMEFKEGGRRLYAMVGPNGEEHWSFADYTSITPKTNFKLQDGFCDDQGNVNKEMPQSNWNVDFTETSGTTTVQVQIKHETLADLEMHIKMGFKEGFEMALSNLDQYIASRFLLRKQNKTNHMARVTTYLNFAGNTEEAFNFYQSVFKTEFSGKGIQKFGDIPAEQGHPPIAEEVKEMILHVELPTLGGHVLMGTDAPKEMGFTLSQGNNMHICLEPETREEADRLFNELSVGGNITMPMADMFFGAYFGEFSDRYGINWMINYQHK